MSVRGLSKRFGPTVALEEFDMDVAVGEIHALVGGNGSGKSTFIKILAGVHSADGGVLEVAAGQGCTERVTYDLTGHSPEAARSAGLVFVHQDLGIFPSMSLTENLAIGHGFEKALLGRIPWRRSGRHAKQTLGRFGLDVDPRAPALSLSVPQRAMLAIARALQDREDTPGVIVLDEPTASLSPPEVRTLLTDIRTLADAGHSIILVTHRLDEVQRAADTVTAIRDGRRVATRSARDLDASDVVELILGRRLAAAAGGPAGYVGDGEPVLDVRGVSGGPVRNVDLSVGAGEILGVAGLVGSGRTELLELLFGARSASAGEIRLDGRDVTGTSPRERRAAGVAFVPEDRQAGAVFQDKSVRENMTAGHVGPYFRRMWLSEGRERRSVAEDIVRFHVKARGAEASIESLSGGNQQKVILARWLREGPKLLLLDEPTQGIDVGAREEMFELVHAAAAAGAAVVVVSSEFEELARLCNRVVIMARGALVGEQSAPTTSHDLLAATLSASNGVHE